MLTLCVVFRDSRTQITYGFYVFGLWHMLRKVTHEETVGLSLAVGRRELVQPFQTGDLDNERPGGI